MCIPRSVVQFPSEHATSSEVVAYQFARRDGMRNQVSCTQPNLSFVHPVGCLPSFDSA